MRRIVVVTVVVAGIGLAGCGGGGSDAKPAPTPVTAPVSRTKTVVGQQNQQLQQIEQRTAQDDPTVP